MRRIPPARTSPRDGRFLSYEARLTSPTPRAALRRGLRQPELLIIDGGTGLQSAIAAVWNEVPVQRCTVHKHRNLLAHAPERLPADYNDMIYGATREEVEARRKVFIRKWRVKHRAVADSLEEAGGSRLIDVQWIDKQAV
jgi:transposase-like protein